VRASTLADLPSVPEVWALVSGKGGVGRSFLAANLGHLLARDIGPVVLVDLDLRGADLHTFLGEATAQVGLDAFVHGGVGSLAELLVQSPIPGLAFVPGAVETPLRLTARERRRLEQAVRALDTSRVLLDLPSGPDGALLDLFMTADRPLIVVVAEPAAVENVHRFVRRVYLRVVSNRLRHTGVEAAERENVEHAAAHLHPERLLGLVDRIQRGLAEQLRDDLEETTLYLVVNQVRHRSDEAVGVAIKNAVQSYFGISVRYVGAIPYDEEAWLSARRRRLHTREAEGDYLAERLEQVVASVVEDVELEPSEEVPARLQLL